MAAVFILFLISTEKKKELCVVTVHKGPTNKDSGLWDDWEITWSIPQLDLLLRQSVLVASLRSQNCMGPVREKFTRM